MESEQSKPSLRERLRSAYRNAGIITMNTVILLAFINLLMWLLGVPRDKTKDQLGQRVLRIHGEARIIKAHPDWSFEDLRQLHEECWGPQLVYDSFTGYKEKPRTGQFVNVHDRGYRGGKDQAAWPPATNALNVFVFGGSTTFGYGLPDHETIPSRLQEQLRQQHPEQPVAVYNFGRAYYYSAQERVLFEKLLVDGKRPDIAVFIDGLNETLPAADSTYRPKWIQTDPPASVLNRLPLIRLVNQLALDTGPKRRRKTLTLDPVDVGRRYLRNQDLIRSVAKAHDIGLLFVIQPIPNYHPNAAAHPFWQPDNQSPEEATYHFLEPKLTGENQPPDVLWAADLQEGHTEILYVDEVHYSAFFSRIIAAAIATRLQDPDRPRQRNRE